jgi:hypothetical protein
MRRILITTAVIAAIALMIAPARAGKGGKGRPSEAGSGPSITLNEPDPSLGDLVSFSVEGVETRDLRIEVMCYQGAELGYMETGPYDNRFELGGGSSVWRSNGGDADCVANAFHYTYAGKVQTGIEVHATTTFHAAG